MSTKEKELENRLQELVNQFGSPPSSASELLPFLDETENLLSRVEQSPSEMLLNSLRPIMTALVSKEFLGHSDIDVKVSVASCLSEITRITAPEAPYDDDTMKDIFQRIVESLEHLDDKSSRSFTKRVSILETVAKVRSCVVMLDLECDNLILEMFRQFLKTIREDHAENIITSMEAIMSLVLEESEDISPELLQCLLDCIKVDNKDVLPIARKLVEKVISNCSAKLKPYLKELFQSLALSKYTDIISSLCQDSSDGLGKNEVDGSKQSDKTVSDELPQGSAKLQEQEVGGPGDDSAGKSPEAVTSNGTVVGNGESAVVPNSPKQKSEPSRRGNQSKKNSTANEDDNDKSDQAAEKADAPTKGQGKQVNSSTPQEDCTELHSPSEAENENLKVSSPKDVDIPEVALLKGGQPNSKTASPRRGSSEVAQEVPSASRHKGLLNKAETEDKAISDQDIVSEKELDGSISSDDKSKRSGKKSGPDDVDDAETPATAKSSVETKSQRMSSRKGSSQDQGESLQKPGKQKAEKDKSGDLSLKDMISPKSGRKAVRHKDDLEESSKNKSGSKRAHESEEDMISPKSGRKAVRYQDNLEESSKKKSGSKRAHESEEVTETPARSKELGESLVGCKIKVWWPDDKEFYQGTVDSFDPNTRRHKISYDDGDVEILLLKKERWEFVKRGKKGGELAKDLGSPDTSSEGVQGKRAKTMSSEALKKSNRDTKSDMGSSIASADLPKRKGRPPKAIVSTIDDSPADSSKLKEKTASKSRTKIKIDDLKSKEDTSKADQSNPKSIGKSKDDAPRSSGKAKDDASRSSGKTKDDAPKSSIKTFDDAPKSSGKTKGDAPKSSGKTKDDAPKSSGKTRDDAVSTGSKVKKDVPKSNSSDESPVIGRKSRGNSSKPSNEAKAISDAEASETQASGKKRRRKSQN